MQKPEHLFMLCRWDWPQKGRDRVGPGSRKHSSQRRLGADSPAACLSHYTAVSTGTPTQVYFRPVFTSVMWRFCKTHHITEDWPQLRSYILLYYPNILQLLKSQIVVCYAPLRQKKLCHSRSDWVYLINWRGLRQESKYWRLRWKYKRKVILYLLHRLNESLVMFSFTVKWMFCFCFYVLQLEENSKLWGRQKQEMLTKLSEHRHGFVRTSTTILHNVPSVSADGFHFT